MHRENQPCNINVAYVRINTDTLRTKNAYIFLVFGCKKGSAGDVKVDILSKNKN